MARTPYPDPEAEAVYQAVEDQSSKPTYHPDSWTGNKQYKELYDAADKAIQNEKDTGRPTGIKLNSPYNTDPDLNPRSMPDSRGLFRKNRVG